MTSDDEYEYEYSTTETETFLIDLDLSSVNQVLKSANAGDRKSLRAPKPPAANKHNAREIEQIAGGDDNENGNDVDNDDEDNDNNNNDPDVAHAPGSPSQQQSQQQKNEVSLDAPAESVQILDLSSYNPIISFKNQIYSCTWTDMIGTTMFFTKHNDAPMHEPEIATEDYDLIGTSRIKLVGQQAKLIPKTKNAEPKKRSLPDNSTSNIGATTEADPDPNDEEGEGEGEEEEDMDEDKPNDNDEDPTDIAKYLPRTYKAQGVKRSALTTQLNIKRQASFLERLKTVKKRRGERDTVRTFVDRHTLQAAEKKREEAAQIRREIATLNGRVVRGNQKALARLQEIYADIEDVESDGEVEEQNNNNGHDERGASARQEVDSERVVTESNATLTPGTSSVPQPG